MFHTTSCTSSHTNRWESARSFVNFSQSWSTQISFGADLASWYAACKTNLQNAICSLLIGIDETEELRIGKNRQMLWISWIPCVRKPIEEYKNAVRLLHNKLWLVPMNSVLFFLKKGTCVWFLVGQQVHFALQFYVWIK